MGLERVAKLKVFGLKFVFLCFSIWSQNAPRLAGMSDWYMSNQIKNFKNGIRGTDRKDEFGGQMALMARMLRDEEDINDVIAYINTL